MLIERIVEIVTAPMQNPDMLWMLIPLIITLLLIEFYFGIYKDELLGWNSAFGNSIVLLFISANLFRFALQNDVESLRMIIALAVFLEACLLILINLFHLLPGRVAFKFSSATPINFIALSSIILVYSNIVIDYLTVLSIIILFVVFSVLIWLIHKMEPTVEGELTEEAPENLEAPEVLDAPEPD